MTRDLIIEASGLCKTYTTGLSTVEALRNVDFAVTRGEMVAIMGPSGCGKTTLLNCLSGLDDVDAGEVRIAGTSLRDMSDNRKTDYRARQMGFVFQVYNLLPVLSAVENVELPLLVSGVRPAEARRRSVAALAAVNLERWARHRPAELSGGQRQRVAVARALVNDPTVIWADEPTGALDSAAAEDIMAMLCHLSEERGQTIVLVTHALDVGERAHRIVHMRDGHIEDDGHCRLDVRESVARDSVPAMAGTHASGWGPHLPRLSATGLQRNAGSHCGATRERSPALRRFHHAVWSVVRTLTGPRLRATLVASGWLLGVVIFAVFLAGCKSGH
jgi:putative ABC transport system ATP-binding protein